MKHPRKTPYGRLWRIVSGAIEDTLNKHPNYIRPKHRERAKNSIAGNSLA